MSILDMDRSRLADAMFARKKDPLVWVWCHNFTHRPARVDWLGDDVGLAINVRGASLAPGVFEDGHREMKPFTYAFTELRAGMLCSCDCGLSVISERQVAQADETAMACKANGTVGRIMACHSHADPAR